MKLEEGSIPIYGKVTTIERNPVTHEVVSVRVDKNILTYLSRNEICKWLANSGSPKAAGAWNYMAIGYGETAAAADQTTLVSELTRQVSVLSVETDSVTSQDIIFQSTTTFTATESANYNTIWEIALLDADTAGDMFNRVKLSVARDNYNNDLEVIYQATFNST